MEASVAAAGAEGQAPGGEAEAAAQAGVDPAEVMARFDSLQGSLESLREQQASQQQQFQQQMVEPEAEPEGLDMSWLDPTQAEFDPQDFQERVGQLIAQASQQAAAPALEAVAALQHQQQAQALRQEFPEMGQPETAQNVITGATEYAGAVMADISPVLQAHGIPPQLIDAIGQGIVSSPATWRAVYLGSKGLDAATAERPVDQGAALLEGGAGSRLGGGQEPDPAQQIVASGGRNVLPF